MSKQVHLHLFNCDRTYKLEAIEGLLNATKAKLDFVPVVEKHYFSLAQMHEIATKTIPELKVDDVAFFVVHAHESRLSINEDNAGIGYANIYRALLEATGGKVIIIIGGDDNYKNEDEEDRVVISRWAKRKILSQFSDDVLDGSKSFIFSWNKKHREIHEEALLHYFDPIKKGKKFEYQPKPRRPKSVQSAQTRIERTLSGTYHSTGEQRGKEVAGASPSNLGYDTSRVNKAPVHHEQRTLPTKTEDLAVLCCNVSEDSLDAVMQTLQHITPKLNLLVHPPVENLLPDKIEGYLKEVRLKTCVLVVDGKTVNDAYKNLPQQREEYQRLLETAEDRVVGKVIILICDTCSLPPKDEDIVSRTIQDILTRREKGYIAWLKKGKLSVEPDVLVTCLMSTLQTPQPNPQTNSWRASQEKMRDAPGSEAELFSTNSGQSQSGPFQRNPSDWGHLQQAPTTIHPLMNTFPATLDPGEQDWGHMQQAPTTIQPFVNPYPAIPVTGEQDWGPMQQAPTTIQPFVNPYPAMLVTGEQDWGHMQQAPTTIQPLMNSYPAILVTGEPVWLRSILRHGRISFELRDLQLWDHAFIVPDFINADLIQLYQQIPEIGVRIVRGNDGQLQWSVDPKWIEVSKSRYKGIEITANDTLVLKTRICEGLISFQENDMDFRYGCFRIPQEIINKLKEEHRSTPCGVLYIILTEKGNLRTIVKIGKFNQFLTFVKKH